MLGKNKRQKIVLAAAAEFAKNGYEKASVDSICDVAKVAKGTFYYHFKSKNEILEAIIGGGEKTFEEILKKRIKNITDPVDKFKKMVAAEREFIKEYGDYFRVFIGEILDKQYRFIIMERVVEEGIEAGIFRRDLDVKRAVLLVFWSVAMTSLNGEKEGQEDILLCGLMK